MEKKNFVFKFDEIINGFAQQVSEAELSNGAREKIEHILQKDLNFDDEIALPEQVIIQSAATKSVTAQLDKSELFNFYEQSTNDIDRKFTKLTRADLEIKNFDIREDWVITNSWDNNLKNVGPVNTLRGFLRLADKALDGNVTTVYGRVMGDSYVAMDMDGEGITYVVKLTGVSNIDSTGFYILSK